MHSYGTLEVLFDEIEKCILVHGKQFDVSRLQTNSFDRVMKEDKVKPELYEKCKTRDEALQNYFYFVENQNLWTSILA